jgi:pyruvate/2-oxoglutarate/acetoin dehydrogenase E1 component
MKYKDALKISMENLSKDSKVVFLGYNVCYGSKAYGTLANISKEQLLETPLAENLMMGLAMGMSLEGYRPVVFIERHDFLFNLLDGIVNHLDKIGRLSQGQFNLPVIIRAVVGSKKPLDPGLQHTQDYTEALKKMVSFPVIELKKPEQIIIEYEKVTKTNSPILFVEWKELYDLEGVY